MAAGLNLLQPTVVDIQEVVVGVVLADSGVAVEVEVLHIHAELRGHKVGDSGFEALSLNVLAESFLGDFPRKSYGSTRIRDGRKVRLCAVAVVCVLGLLTENTRSDTDFVDFACTRSAHFVANEALQRSSLKGLLNKATGLLGIEQAACYASGSEGVFQNLSVVRHFCFLLFDY